RERHDRAHDELALAPLAERRQRLAEPGPRHREHDDPGQRRRLAVVRADDRDLAGPLPELGRPRLRALRIARADENVVARERPADGQARALLAGAADDGDLHAGHLNKSRDGSRSKGLEPSSATGSSSPRTMAAGMRASLPITSSAAPASSSATARIVACSVWPAGARAPREPRRGAAAQAPVAALVSPVRPGPPEASA